MTSDGSVEIGRIAKAHGLRGEVGVKLHWSASEVLFSVDEVFVESDAGQRTLRVEACRPTPKGVLLKLAGIDDRTAAEALRGASVSVPRALLPELEEGEFYLADLLGAKVIAPDGEVGEVIEVRMDPSVDTAVIRTPDGKSVEQPLVEAWLDEVDLEARVIRLSSRDGLVD